MQSTLISFGGISSSSDALSSIGGDRKGDGAAGRMEHETLFQPASAGFLVGGKEPTYGTTAAASSLQMPQKVTPPNTSLEDGRASPSGLRDEGVGGKRVYSDIEGIDRRRKIKKDLFASARRHETRPGSPVETGGSDEQRQLAGSQSPVASSQLEVTQEIDYEPRSQASLQEISKDSYFLRGKNERYIVLHNHGCDDADEDVVVVAVLGRCNSDRDARGHCDVHIENNFVSRAHAVLRYHPKKKAFVLEPLSQPCWLKEAGRWKQVDRGCLLTLMIGDTFRLLAPQETGYASYTDDTEFTLGKCGLSRHQCLPGSSSFDFEYVRLLQEINSKGERQANKKGENITLPSQHTLTIDLRDDHDRILLPLTTLRLVFPRSIMVETLWYLRGEDNILFLQGNRCPYWDAQATGEDGTFVGLNYGLLTNFPDGKGGSINQLQAKVIEPLCRGECSRNMYCSLSKPGEDTVQEACTSGLQFAASDGCTLLSLTVNQRSSDIILGLPNDVVAMSLLLHFVIREVRLQSGRVLHPDKVEFAIAAGGAHVYMMNKGDFDQLLERQPKPKVQPYLDILDPSSMISIFDVAKVYDNNKKVHDEDNVFPWKIKGYGTEASHPRIIIQQATDK